MLLLTTLCGRLSAQTSATQMSTEGVDFWLSFLTNNAKDVSDPSLNFTVYAVADEAVTIIIEAGMPASQIGSITIPAGGGYGIADHLSAAAVYLNAADSETPQSKGIHIYAADGRTKFSCFALAEAGTGEGTTRDATLLIPTEYLDREYFVQTYPDDGNSTEFVVVATEDNTQIVVTPAAQTYNGAAAATPITITLNKGQVYMVRSAPKSAQVPNIDMSGSTVCADKPVAVFSGNEATKIPNQGAYSANHTFEQMAPQSMWGKTFYFALTAKSKLNKFYITAAFDNTTVTINRYDSQSGTVYTYSETLNAGESLPEPDELDNEITDVYIESDKPVVCYRYLTCGAANQEEYRDDKGKRQYRNWGNPTNALVPSWDQRVKSISFYADTIGFQTAVGVRHQYVQIVTQASEVGLITLDGITIPTDSFHTFGSSTSMVYANIEVPDYGIHTLASTGEGFVGAVYGITSEARAYQYTLGFNPMPYRDSLFFENQEIVMSPKSYELERFPQGWYQRQPDEWPIGEERLDTAYICDSTTLNFFGQLATPNLNDSVVWKLYRCTPDGQRIESPVVAEFTSTTIGTLEHRWEYQFTMEPQKELKPHERTPFELYALDMEKYHKHLICTDLPDDADTLRTMIHVNRVYQDTILRRVVCVTDTVRCYNDDPDHTTVSPSSTYTVFMSRDQLTGDAYTEGFDLGYQIYQRDYKTIFGCDSIMSFELWVCDTVRIILDTTVCDNEPLRFPGSLYFQNETFPTGGTYLDTIKTHNCDPLKEIDPTFIGCDSIFQVNVTMCKTYVNTKTDQYCSHGHWEIPYEWRRKGVVPEHTDSLVREIYLTEEDAGTWKEYRDTVKTVTCLDCDQGGCDSIFILKLFVTPYIHYKDTQAYCGQSYVPDRNSKGDYIGPGHMEDVPYTWTQHADHTVWDANNAMRIPASEIQNMTLGTTDVFTDSMTNIYGCDSIYTLVLTRNQPYYFRDVQTKPNTQSFMWQGKRYGPYPEEWKDTVLYYRSSRATTTAAGCDSVIILELRLSQSFLQREDSVICRSQTTFIWKDHLYDDADPTKIRTLYDKTRSDRSIPVDADKILTRYTHPNEREVHIFHDSLKMMKEGVECDSIFILTLTVNPVYDFTDSLFICDLDTFTWQGIRYAGNKAPAYPAFTPDKVLPLGETKDQVMLSTIAHCDSVRRLVVNVFESFYNETSAVVCQDSNFVWPEHMDHQLVDENGDPVVLSTAVPGDYIYIDHLYTSNCSRCSDTQPGCDSIYRLNLTVNPSYIGQRMVIQDELICSNDAPFVWTGHTNAQGNVMQFSESVTVRDTITTIGCGCDSVVELRLTVVDNGDKSLDTTLCQNSDPFIFGVQRWEFSPADSLPGTYTRTENVIIGGGCGYRETLTINVNAAYLTLTESDMVCRTDNDTYTWRGQTVSIDETATIVLVDSDYTQRCHCDSITTFTLEILPSYQQDSATELSDEGWLHWDRIVYGGPNAPPSAGVTDTIYKDTLIVHTYTVAGSPIDCDSIRTLDIRFGNIFRQTDTLETCDNYPFTWYGKDQDGNDSVRMVIAVEDLQNESIYVDAHRTALGFDSVYYLFLIVHPSFPAALERTDIDSVCQRHTYTWTGHGKSYTLPHIGNYTFYDTIPSQYGCDSIWTLQLRVDSIYRIIDPHTMCDNDTLVWENMILIGANFSGDPGDLSQYDHVFAPVAVQQTDSFTFVKLPSSHSCDSSRILSLEVLPTFLEVAATDTAYRHICDNDTLHYYDHEYNTGGEWKDRSHRIIRTLLKDTVPSVHGCDSVTAMVVYVHPTWYLQSNDTTTCRNTSFVWPDHEGHRLYCPELDDYFTTIPTGTDGTFTFIDSLKTFTCATCPGENGCDSVWTIRLTVTPTYDNPHSKSMSDEETYFWEHTLYIGEKVNPDTLSDDLYHNEPVHQTVVAPTGRNFYDTLYFTATYHCDSIERLTLTVGPTYRDTLHDQHTCFNRTYYWRRDGALPGHTDSLVMAITPDSSMLNRVTYFSDTAHTAEFGFDSIHVLELSVHPTYLMPADYDTVCHGSPYVWNDADGKPHTVALYGENHIHYPAVPTDTLGWITIYDSLKTVTCPDCQAGAGCDSVHVLHLYVAPTYYFPESYSICGNDTLLWQRSLYVGATYDTATYGVPPMHTTQHDTVIYLPNRRLFLDTAEYRTAVIECDSIYYLNLTIVPTAFTLLHDRISDNDSIWYFGHGYNYHRGQDYYYPDLSDTINRVPYSLLLIDTVQTYEGCDSIIHDSLTVYPEYRFVLDTFTCANNRLDWRKYKEINHLWSGTFYDSLKTAAGFDSVYVLHLTIIPAFEMTQRRDFCKNDTILWHHTLIYWTPEDGDIPIEYVARYSRGEGCDSVYTLITTYHDYFHRAATVDTCCRFDEYHWLEPDGSEHTRGLRDEQGRVLTAIPTDTLGWITIYDSLSTSSQCRCDSTFTLRLFVKPAYHFYETHAPACTGTPVVWRDSVYTADSATVITDVRSFQTTGGCDSVFHFTLQFYQTYEFKTDSFEFCANETPLVWHEISTKPYFDASIDERHRTDDTIRLDKVYSTVNLCDSIYRLHLVIHPALWDEWDDTICIGEKLQFNDRVLTEQGTYYDTLVTEFGCPLYQVLNLAVVPATRFAVLVDSTCADYGNYEMTIPYEGLRPDSFAIFFDSTALARGFVDLIKDTFIDSIIMMDIPQAQPFMYPDNYTATLFLFSRHCKEDSTMMLRYTFAIRYPLSILSQHWNDMIAIYDSAYNGGFRFSAFQWYRNDTLMPGETAHFLYQPHWLDNGEQYSVRLTRQGESYGIMSCPITISWDTDRRVTPTMQYLSVVPTVVSRDYPVTNILSLLEGDYRVIDPYGSVVNTGRIQPDEHHAMYLPLPDVPGLYVVEMEDVEGNSRSVKVMVY